MRKLTATIFSIVVVTASAASAAPKESAATCKDGFDCGRLAAQLDYPEAFVAIRRAVAFDKMFEGQYASMLISAGPKRGGDAAKGLAILEDLCKKQQARTVSVGGGTDHSMAYNQTECSTLARIYERPPKESGLAPDPAKAERILRAECTRGDALECGSLGDLYLKGGDRAKARAAMQEGCDKMGMDSDLVGPYAAGVCGSLGEALYKGSFGAKDVKGALTILEKACTEQYRCDLAVQILTDGKDGVPVDLDKAKKLAVASCNRFLCGPMEPLESKDPTWAKEEYRKLCEDAKTPRREACRGFARMGGTPKTS